MNEFVSTSIEDVLGPSEKRFFGSGFKRVGYEWTEKNLSSQCAAYEVKLRYPETWSRKQDNTKLLPHLSSIDALIIAISMAERIVSKSKLPINDLWVSKASIKAGSKPIESLDSVSATMQIENDLATRRSFFADIGSMRVFLILENSSTSDNRCRSSEDTDVKSNYYSECARNRNQLIDNIFLNNKFIANAKLSITPIFMGMASGIESTYGMPTLIDWFVTHLQLGQILLYQLDGLRRTESNTLWMRTTSFSVDAPTTDCNKDISIETSLKDSQLINNQNGSWRTATIMGKSTHVKMRCSVAHLLPKR